MSTILDLKGISKQFPGVQALDNVTLSIQEGKLHCILGQNGAGKSTLIKILAGAYPADKGEIIYKGQPVVIPDPHTAHRMGVSVIYQELDLIPYLSAAENIWLGRYPRLVPGIVNWGRVRQASKQLLSELGCSFDPATILNDLSPGEQQMVAIARAVSDESSVIIMDEPTSSLSEHEQRELFRTIDDLKKHGTTIIYITHKLEEVFRLGDQATVLRDGRVIGTWDVAGVNQDFLVEQMIGHRIARRTRTNGIAHENVLLRVEGLSTRKLLRHVSFRLYKGEVLGLAGLVGSGRTQVMRILFGADPLEQGTIFLEEKPFQPRNPRHAKAQGLALVPEDRKTQGLVLSQSVLENTLLPSYGNFHRFGVVQSEASRVKAQAELSRLNAKVPSLAAEVSTLSGGNQQKVVVGKWLLAGARVLLLDEPTRGIDVGAKDEIYQIIRELTKSGIGVVVISSEFPDLLAVCDRILVMHAGRIVGEFDAKETSKEEIMERAILGAG